VNVTSNLTEVPTECGNLSFLTSKPDEDLLIAGIALSGLWASSNGGDSWEAMGDGDGSDVITNRTSSIVFDPEHPEVFWETGIYNGGGVYRTADNGSTFEQLGDVTHNDLVSVDFTDPDRQTLLAGGHEQFQRLFLSLDGGSSWEDIGPNVPADTGASGYPLIIDSTTFLLGCAGFGGSLRGVFRSTDQGETWDHASESGGHFAPLVASDGSIYWATQDNQGIAKSTDQGETWTDLAGLFRSAGPVELPDGSIAALGDQNIVLSGDGGETWRAVTARYPYTPRGFTYSPYQRAFFIYYFSCGAPEDATVPEDAVMRFDYDFEDTDGG
jgi:photosystem II stability/assembly factor-like uncharacterized protein